MSLSGELCSTVCCWNFSIIVLVVILFFVFDFTVHGFENPLYCACDSHDALREVFQRNTQENRGGGGETLVLSAFKVGHAAH